MTSGNKIWKANSRTDYLCVFPHSIRRISTVSIADELYVDEIDDRRIKSCFMTRHILENITNTIRATVAKLGRSVIFLKINNR